MKRLLRKLTALLVAMAMCLGLLGGAYAVEGGELADSSAEPEAAVLWEAEDSSDAAVDDEADSEAAQSSEANEADAEEEADGEEEDDSASDQVTMLSTAAQQSKVEEPQEEEQDPDLGVDFIKQAELYLQLNATKTLKLTQPPSGEAYFVSSAPEVVSVNKTSGKLKGLAPGRATIELRKGNGTKLDQVEVFCFRPTTWSRDTKNNKREKPSVLHTKNSAHPGYSDRDYTLVCQQKQKDKPYGSYLASHGCAVCSVAAVCQGYGVSDMTVDWLMTGGLEEIAARENVTLSDDDPLGYYGLQKVLEYGGMTSKIYCNWGNDVAAAAEEMVKCLSQGRPILMFVDHNSWNNITLCNAAHCVVIAGLSEDGYLEMINGSYPQGVNYFYQKSSGKVEAVKLTPMQLLAHFTRAGTKKAVRRKENDFYLTLGGGSGLQSFLELTCDYSVKTPRVSVETLKPVVASTSYTYNGKARTPKVTINGLKEEQDFRVRYSNNKNAGKATVSVYGIGDYVGTWKGTFTIKQKAGEITAADKSVVTSSKAQKVKLEASAKGSAKITYKSGNKKVTVSSKGVVTVPKKFVGQVTLTLNAAKTTNYKAASKKITLTVRPAGRNLSSAANAKGAKLKAKWKKVSGVTGYQIQYWKKDDFKKGARLVTVKGAAKTSAVVSKLTKGKKYYVRLRTYKTVSGKNLYSKWSNTKGVTIRK